MSLLYSHPLLTEYTVLCRAKGEPTAAAAVASILKQGEDSRKEYDVPLSRLYETWYEMKKTPFIFLRSTKSSCLKILLTKMTSAMLETQSCISDGVHNTASLKDCSEDLKSIITN